VPFCRTLPRLGYGEVFLLDNPSSFSSRCLSPNLYVKFSFFSRSTRLQGGSETSKVALPLGPNLPRRIAVRCEAPRLNPTCLKANRAYFGPPFFLSVTPYCCWPLLHRNLFRTGKVPGRFYGPKRARDVPCFLSPLAFLRIFFLFSVRYSPNYCSGVDRTPSGRFGSSAFLGSPFRCSKALPSWVFNAGPPR